MATRQSTFLTITCLPLATLMFASPVEAQIFKDGDRVAKPAKPAPTASPPKIDPADIGKPPVSPGDDVSWRPPVIPPLADGSIAPDTDTGGGKPPVSPGDEVGWRPPVIPPLNNSAAKTDPKIR